MKVLELNEKYLKCLGVLEFHIHGYAFPHMIIVGIFLTVNCLLNFGSIMYFLAESDLNDSAAAIYVIISMCISFGSHISMALKIRKTRTFFDDMKRLVNESKYLSIIYYI